jgi:tRNA(Ile2) C34 agmatinyltransferase TiaS
MSIHRMGVAGALIILLSAVSALAHHSFAAEYDQNKPVKVQGTVNKVAWVNPHAYLYIDVKDEAGKVTIWAFELLSPNALARQGWNAKSLMPGDAVTVDGYAAKDGKTLFDGAVHANSRMVTTTDGKKVYIGTSLGQ